MGCTNAKAALPGQSTVMSSKDKTITDSLFNDDNQMKINKNENDGNMFKNIIHETEDYLNNVTNEVLNYGSNLTGLNLNKNTDNLKNDEMDKIDEEKIINVQEIENPDKPPLTPIMEDVNNEWNKKNDEIMPENVTKTDESVVMNNDSVPPPPSASAPPELLEANEIDQIADVISKEVINESIPAADCQNVDKPETDAEIVESELKNEEEKIENNKEITEDVVEVSKINEPEGVTPPDEQTSEPSPPPPAQEETAATQEEETVATQDEETAALDGEEKNTEPENKTNETVNFESTNQSTENDSSENQLNNTDNLNLNTETEVGEKEEKVDNQASESVNDNSNSMVITDG